MNVEKSDRAAAALLTPVATQTRLKPGHRGTIAPCLDIKANMKRVFLRRNDVRRLRPLFTAERRFYVHAKDQGDVNHVLLYLPPIMLCAILIDGVYSAPNTHIL